ncbi:DUF167 domain-containing protein [Trichloromonas sp.]|uniref:DUF167 domain-containing protein n=1 Tax=Trichloromonas sp. TaxID=3069249 RepID=UPI002A42E8EE|nr:DUF167 domain-containing protein [Trichloromonas sp.]
MSPFARQEPAGIVLSLWVQPRASRNEVVEVRDGELKVRLTSPPVEGAANELCRDYFAKLLGVSRGDVRLVAGERSRHKRLLISGPSLEEVRERIAVTMK